MRYNSDIHHRSSIRLKGYDYSKKGIYFVTVCTQNRENIFGKVINETMILNETGIIVENTWFDLPNHNSNIVLDMFIIMPNHVHAIITVGAGSKPVPDCGTQNDGTGQIDGVGQINITGQIDGADQIDRAGFEPAPTKEIPLSEIVRQFKTFSSKKINKQRNTVGIPVWQRNYYEHIIRNEDELNRIRQYIKNNPGNWNTDKNFVAG